MTPATAGLRRDAITALAIFALALALAAALRYRLIEPAALAHACTDDPGAALCRFRELVVRSFRHQEPGWIAALAGAIGWLLAPRAIAFTRLGPGRDRAMDTAASGRHAGAWPVARRLARLAAFLAVAFGAIGLVLYSFDPAAVGLMLGVIALSRLPAARRGAATSR